MIKNLLILSGFSAFVVFLWIGLTLYHNSVDTTIPASTQQKVIPITPTFDKETLEALKKREAIQSNLGNQAQILNDSATISAGVNSIPIQETIASQGASF